MSVRLSRSSKPTLTGHPVALRGTLSVAWSLLLRLNPLHHLYIVISSNIYLNENFSIYIPSFPQQHHCVNQHVQPAQQRSESTACDTHFRKQRRWAAKCEQKQQEQKHENTGDSSRDFIHRLVYRVLPTAPFVYL